MRRAGAAVLPLTALCLAAFAQMPAQAQEGHDCHDGHVTDDPATLRPGIVIGKSSHNHFYSGTDKRNDCPGAGAVCRSKAYVVRGDKLIVAEEKASGFVCAAFVSRKGAVSAGWLPEGVVDVKPAPSPPLADWLGRWRYLNSNITIKRGKKAGSLDIEGDSWSKRYQAVNTGDIYGENLVPQGHSLSFAHSGGEIVPVEKADKLDCVLKFAIIHDVLVVEDNGNCGGAGVYFTGFYRRKR